MLIVVCKKNLNYNIIMIITIYCGKGIVRMSTSAVFAGSERCLMVARISCKFDGSEMSARGTTEGGVMGRDGE